MDAKEKPQVVVSCIISDDPVQTLKLSFTKGASLSEAPLLTEAIATLYEVQELNQAEDINRKIDSVVDLWGSIPDEHGDPFPYPLKRSVVKSTIAVIVESLAAKPTDKATIERINDINEVLNHALVRQFTGSKAMIIVALIVGILLSIGAGQAAPIIFFGISLLFYLLASRTATFVIAAKQAKGRNSSVSFLTGLIGSLFMGVATAKTYKTVTTYSDGTTKTETDNSQTWISLIFGLVVMFILACILILISLINYIRNYLIYW